MGINTPSRVRIPPSPLRGTPASAGPIAALCCKDAGANGGDRDALGWPLRGGAPRPACSQRSAARARGSGKFGNLRMFQPPRVYGAGKSESTQTGRMLDKAHKPSGKPLWAALARLCSLPLSVLLSTCAFGGAAYAAGPNASATAGVGSVPVQDQARDLPRPPPSGAAHLTG